MSTAGTIYNDLPSCRFIQEFTIGNVASVAITSVFSATYNTYLFDLINFWNTVNDVGLGVRISQDGGASWKTDASYWWGRSYACSHSQNAAHNCDGAASDYYPVGGGQYTGNPACGELYLSRGPGAGVNSPRYMQAHFACRHSTYNEHSLITGCAYVGNTNPVNGILFFYTSGNFSSGIIRVYGWSL